MLSLEELGVTFDTPQGAVAAAREVTLSVARGECLGVVGESGAGKSQVFLAVMGLLAANGRAQGSARFGGAGAARTRARRARSRARRRHRHGVPGSDDLAHPASHGRGTARPRCCGGTKRLARMQARAQALALLEQVHVSDAGRRLAQYPHELSGGMRQRVVIAIALRGEPQLLIADEPTTSLDVTIQAQILALLAELKRARGMAIVLITHDLAAVAGVADRVAVMRNGRVIEAGAVREVLKAPRDPYTQALVRDAARLAGAGGRAAAESPAPAPRAPHAATPGQHRGAARRGGERAVWRRARLARRACAARGTVGRDFELQAGESLGIVGESGAGKSTLARAVLQLLRPCAGRIVWMGRELQRLPPRELRALRGELQIIFQDPLGSLDPRMTVGEIVTEPLRVHAPALAAGARAAQCAAMLEQRRARAGARRALSA